MKKFALVCSFAIVLGFSIPVMAQTTKITNMEYVQEVKEKAAKQAKSSNVFSTIGSIIGLGLIIWFIISRFTKKKKA